MTRQRIWLGVIGTSAILAVVFVLIRGQARTIPRQETSASLRDVEVSQSLFDPETDSRIAAIAADPAVRKQTLPAHGGLRNPPTSEEELRAWVDWMRGLSREDLLRLSNADYGFVKSDLVRMLKDLEGDWVVPALKRLALSETDDLVQAVLVVGLFGSGSMERRRDPQYLDAIAGLLPQYSDGTRDPFKVTQTLVMGAWSACVVQKQEFSNVVGPYLDSSDNADLLTTGFLYLGRCPGSEATLVAALSGHANPSARFGALEGLRSAGRAGRIESTEITRLGRDALAQETNERNRILLVEMMSAAGGDSGLDALAEFVRDPTSGLLAYSAPLLAVNGDPERARQVFDEALQNPELSDGDRQAVYNALGALPGDAGGEFLVGVVRDEQRSDDERLQGLKGLWNRPMDDKVAGELTDIVHGDSSGALRAESLRMLVLSGKSASVGAQELAEADPDPNVRKEAVVLAAFTPDTDSTGWLEERLLNDRSPDVQAAALGAMVVQAHYAGGGERVLNHLATVRKLTDDPQVLDLLTRGEEMVRSYDPRAVDLELKQKATNYAMIAQYADGAGKHALEMQAAYYERIAAVMQGLQRK